jgi:hypothetical protein
VSSLRKAWQTLTGTRSPKQLELQHPQLGVVRFDHSEECWTTTVKAGDRDIRLFIDGDDQPDPRDVAHAAEISSSFEAFSQRVVEYLQAEAAKSPKAIADEILQLEIESMVFSSEKHPRNAMVWFDGADAFRAWRCDYHKGELCYLGFDD